MINKSQQIRAKQLIFLVISIVSSTNCMITSASRNMSSRIVAARRIQRNQFCIPARFKRQGIKPALRQFHSSSARNVKDLSNVLNIKVIREPNVEKTIAKMYTGVSCGICKKPDLDVFWFNKHSMGAHKACYDSIKQPQEKVERKIQEFVSIYAKQNPKIKVAIHRYIMGYIEDLVKAEYNCDSILEYRDQYGLIALSKLFDESSTIILRIYKVNFDLNIPERSFYEPTYSRLKQLEQEVYEERARAKYKKTLFKGLGVAAGMVTIGLGSHYYLTKVVNEKNDTTHSQKNLHKRFPPST